MLAHQPARPNRVHKCYGLVVHLQLLPTPPRGDAVTFSYRPESVYLKRTYTSLTKHTYRRTPRHRQADPQAQEAFQRQLPQRLQTISQAYPRKRLIVFFQDESRFGQQGTTTNVWATQGSRPEVVRQTEYEYLGVLGIVSPQTGRAAGLISPRLNTDVVNVFLREFSQTLASDEQAVIIWDGAGFHTSKKLLVPENITLVQLPPDSPELNPLENLWNYLKSHFWSNRAYDSYEALEQAATKA